MQCSCKLKGYKIGVNVDLKTKGVYKMSVLGILCLKNFIHRRRTEKSYFIKALGKVTIFSMVYCLRTGTVS